MTNRTKTLKKNEPEKMATKFFYKVRHILIFLNVAPDTLVQCFCRGLLLQWLKLIQLNGNVKIYSIFLFTDFFKNLLVN